MTNGGQGWGNRGPSQQPTPSSWGNNAGSNNQPRSSTWGGSSSPTGSQRSSWGSSASTSSTSSSSTRATGWGASSNNTSSGTGSVRNWGPPTVEEERASKPRKKVSKGWLLGLGIPSFLLTAAAVGYFGIICPPAKHYEASNTGAESLSKLMACLPTYDRVCLANWSQGKDWLSKEWDYTNGDKIRQQFILNVMSTVGYELPEVPSLTWNGKEAIDPLKRIPTYETATLNRDGEEVTYKYIDWSKVTWSDDDLKNLIAEDEIPLTAADVDYSHRLTTLFAKALPKELPVTTMQRVPDMDCNGEGWDKICAIKSSEEAFWDDLLFASDDFLKAQDRFAEQVGTLLNAPLRVAPAPVPAPAPADPNAPAPADPNAPAPVSTPVDPNAAPADPNAPAPVPDPAPVDPNAAPVDPNAAPADEGEKKVERKFLDAFYTEPAWIGAHRLLTATGPDGKPIADNQPRLGQGSFDSPAALGTPVLTFQYGPEGVIQPLRVSLQSFVTGDKALQELALINPQNKGLTTNSDVKYAYYTFKVTNLSTFPVDIWVNDTLADAQRNTSPATGVVYGLRNRADQVPPGESVILQGWTSSLKLDSLYLIWGANFARDANPVWFRVLKGAPADEQQR